MKKLVLILLTLILFVVCKPKPAPLTRLPVKKTGPVLARVGNETLTRDQLLLLFRGQIPPDAPREKLQAVLESWVNGELWYQEAVRLGVGQDETTQLMLYNEAHNAIATMLLSRIKDTITVSDSELADYFAQHKDDYLIGTQIMYMILRDEATAFNTLKEIKAGRDFAELARERSYETPESRGQKTTYFTRGDSLVFLLQLSLELNEAIFALKPGEVSNPVEVAGAGGSTWWLVKCLDRRKLKSDVKLADVARSLTEELLPYKQKKAVGEFAEALARKTRVEVMVDNFYGGAPK